MPDGTWIGWFVDQEINSFLCRVPYNYAQDLCNVIGLELLVPNFIKSMGSILDTNFGEDYSSKPSRSDHEQCAQLYGLIHARYILSPQGIYDMFIKYERGDFGICPRFYCNGQLVLPVGLSDRIGESSVKLYCPRCRDVYMPNEHQGLLDGAMFGTSFPHMFFMQLPHLLPEPPVKNYVPRLYGFKVHSSALFPSNSSVVAVNDPKCCDDNGNTSDKSKKDNIKSSQAGNDTKVSDRSQ